MFTLNLQNLGVKVSTNNPFQFSFKGQPYDVLKIFEVKGKDKSFFFVNKSGTTIVIKSKSNGSIAEQTSVNRGTYSSFICEAIIKSGIP